MTCFVMQWRDYLKDFKVDSFEDHRDALGFHGKLDFDDNVQSTFLVLDEMDLKSPKMSSGMRRDIYAMTMTDGIEMAEGRKISAEELFLRLELWMKED